MDTAELQVQTVLGPLQVETAQDTTRDSQEPVIRNYSKQDGEMVSSKSNKNTGRIIPFILIISKDDKCVKNQTPFQASRYASKPKC